MPMVKMIDANAKDEILKQAKKVFAEVGYKEATIRQICKSAKTNVCLVSYYYGGKEGLYKAVFEQIGQDRMDRAQRDFHEGLNIQSKEEYKIRLKMILEQIFSDQLTRSDELIIIQRELMDGMPRAGELVQQFIGNVRKFFNDFIAYGIEKKFVREDLDPQFVVSAALNTLIGFSVQLHFSHKDNHGKFFFPNVPLKDVPQKIFENFIPIFINGLTSESSP